MKNTHLITLILVVLFSAQVKAAITVTNTNDSGAGSLRAAIAAATAGDTIQFASNLAGKTITLASTLSITKPLTIMGLGASQLTIDGGKAYTVFNVAANVTAAISGMTITHGNGGNGGGIHNDGNLTISDCNISSNQTLFGHGAGIYNSLNLTVLNCTISNNSINISGGFCGGGIYFDGSYGGSMTVSNSVFSGNYTGSWGGGIFYNGNHNAVGALTIRNSTFSGNSSGYSSGAAIYVSSGSAVITTCTISSNTGEAIVNSSSGATMAITACTISGNGTTSGATTGGGIYNNNNCTLTLSDSTVSGNTAYDGGGIYNSGTLVVNDSTIAQNLASDSSYGGGGIYNMSYASVSLANTIVAGNHNGISPDIYGPVTANYCLIGNTTGAGTITGTGNIQGSTGNPVNPLLATLGTYGGPTMPDGSQMQTMPLLASSPAIDKGSNALIPSGLTTDQRGLPRIRNGTVDIGACESIITTSITPPPNTPGNALCPVNTATTPPSGNLKRWNGSSWQSITSWNDQNIHTGKPTVVIAHGWKIDYSDFFASNSRNSEIAGAFYDQNSSANIFAWDWQNQAVSKIGQPIQQGYTDIQNEGLRGAADSARRGSSQGVLLAHELQGLHISNSNLQLIGHSNGGAVVGAAATELALCGQKVERITTLDTPNLSLSEIPVAVLLSSLPLGGIDSNLLSTNVNAMQYVDVKSASQVEVYYSGLEAGRHAFGFGEPLIASNGGNRFNGLIYPGTVTDPNNTNQWDHFRIIDWYCGKDGTPKSPGPKQFIAGIDWSILSADAGSFKAGTYAEQSLNSGVFGQFTPAQLPPVTLKKVWWDSFDTVSDYIQNWLGQHADLFLCGDIGNAVARITSGSDGYLWQEMFIPQNASYLTFDLKVETPEAGDFLTVSLDNEIIYYKALSTADSNFWTVDPIFIGNFAGQMETLLFALNHAGSGTSSILLDNITFSVTLPPPRPMTVDLNHDGMPNFYDFSVFAKFWQNASCSEPNWCNGSDFDKNGIVDIHDLQTFAELWLWPVADVVMDGAVDFVDYAVFANHWREQNCAEPNWCEGTDFDHSGSVDMLDLAIFARYWLEGI